jgi:hypothetical protein
MADPDRLSQQSISEQLASQASASQEPLSQQSLLIETGMQAARSSVKDRADIRAQARDLTVQALRDRRFEPQAFRDVLRAVTEGVRRAAEQRPHGVRSAISDALTGLDGAMMKAAEAASLALRELTAQGKEFSDTEIKPVQESIKKIEADFLDTAPHAAEHESVIVRKEMLDALSHLTRTGTDTGAEVAATLNEFAGRMTRISIESAKLGLEAASDFSARFAFLASGMLAGLADTLREQAQSREKKESGSGL